MIHKPIYLFILFIAISLNVFATSDEVIVADGTSQYWDLRGNDGHDGEDGLNAYSAECDDISILSGRAGENGGNGEDGEHGADAYIRYDKVEHLKSILLDQRGGAGGKPGQGGFGAPGCNGGAFGENGYPGSPGIDGGLGRIFLIAKNQPFVKDNISELVTLSDLAENSIVFHRNHWSKFDGAKKLFHKDSYIQNDYFRMHSVSQIKVSLKWSVKDSIESYAYTKLGIALKGDRLVLNSVQGAVFDYLIHQNDSGFVIEVKRVIYEYHFKNLSMGKMRANGELLNLEIKEKFAPPIFIETSFVLTLIHINELTGLEDIIGYYSIPKDLLEKKGKSYFLDIGKLNFPSHFKRKGKKIKVHASIYRKSRGQTRIVSLKGIFKI